MNKIKLFYVITCVGAGLTWLFALEDNMQVGFIIAGFTLACSCGCIIYGVKKYEIEAKMK